MKNLDTASEPSTTFNRMDVLDAGGIFNEGALARQFAGIDADNAVARGFPQSGLPYFWCEGQPCAPVPSAARFINLMIKRWLDLFMALAAVIALGPALLGLALAIRLSSAGPVLFRQERVGRDGKPFTVFKFRTMFIDRCDISGVAQTTTEDARVTPLGKVLRKTSIDELPQLFNVLRGEMSVVGPRPHVAGMLAGSVAYEELVPYYGLRYAMRPGITGWAQANGLRGPTTDARLARKRVDHDIAYIQNFSVLLDIKAIVLTIKNEFLTGSGV